MIIPKCVALLILQQSFFMARSKEFDEQQVLEKAIELFWVKGYNITSAQDLVDGLGISRSSLYDTYSDKRSLFLDTLKTYREKNIKRLTDLIAEIDNPEKSIRTILQMAISENVECKLHKGCFMTNSTVEMALHDKEVAAIVRSHMQAVEELFYTVIKEGQEMGQFTTTQTARSLARFLFNNVSGISVAGKYGADKKQVDDVVKVILSALIK
jgi:TetR/AcrR family transcriptional regulator, transcriptional repressor for nem operon